MCTRRNIAVLITERAATDGTLSRCARSLKQLECECSALGMFAVARVDGAAAVKDGETSLYEGRMTLWMMCYSPCDRPGILFGACSAAGYAAACAVHVSR